MGAKNIKQKPHVASLVTTSGATNYVCVYYTMQKIARAINNIQREAGYFLYHKRVTLVFIIFFCNWKTPYIKASAVGGHPGT